MHPSNHFQSMTLTWELTKAIWMHLHSHHLSNHSRWMILVLHHLDPPFVSNHHILLLKKKWVRKREHIAGNYLPLSLVPIYCADKNPKVVNNNNNLRAKNKINFQSLPNSSKEEKKYHQRNRPPSQKSCLMKKMRFSSPMTMYHFVMMKMTT